MRLKNKTAVITGSTRGIGREIAISFAKEGASVIITGRAQKSVDATIAELRKSDILVDGFACDVTNLKNVEEIANKILDKYKRVDILINNAGITKDNLLLRMSENDWDDVINVNLKGAFHCTKIFSKVMLKAKYGRIVNVSSIIGIIGNIGQTNYAASKSGLIGFTKAVASEFASRGILVNAVAPGYIQTEMTAQLKDKAREDILRKIPLKYFGQAIDVANACLFLASDEASYITGQTIIVDGGMAI